MSFVDSQSGALIVFGENPTPVVLVGACSRGDLIGFGSGWKRALADADNLVQARCVAAEDGVDGQAIIAYFGTTVIDGDRFSGGEVGEPVYVSATDPGQYTLTEPEGEGQGNKIIGYMITKTRAAVTPNAAPDSTAIGAD